jgi:hypothetical protein
MGYLIVRRKGYRRKGGTYVKPTVYKIKDRGAKGRGKKLIPIEKGKLEPYSTSLSERRRHAILKKKIKAYGATRVWHMLHAQVILRKRENSRAKQIFKTDRDWVSRNFRLRRKGRRRRKR